jgi:hypothetical protein
MPVSWIEKGYTGYQSAELGLVLIWLVCEEGATVMGVLEFLEARGGEVGFGV